MLLTEISDIKSVKATHTHSETEMRFGSEKCIKVSVDISFLLSSGRSKANEKSPEKLQITCNVYEPKELFSFAFLSNADGTMQMLFHRMLKFPLS